MSEALDYGYSLFETIRFQQGGPQNITGHYARLSSSAKQLAIPFHRSEGLFKEEVERAVLESGLETGALRYQLMRGADEEVSLSVRPLRYSAEMYDRGFKLCLSGTVKYSGSLLVGHKTSNYMENIITLRAAKENGYDEALLTNEKNELTEGTYTNIFLIKGKSIYTPDGACGLLKGTMRARVIEAARQLGIDCLEDSISAQRFGDYDAGFLTNALMGIMPIRQIGERIFYKTDHVLIETLSEYAMREWVLGVDSEKR